MEPAGNETFERQTSPNKFYRHIKFVGLQEILVVLFTYLSIGAINCISVIFYIVYNDAIGKANRIFFYVNIYKSKEIKMRKLLSIIFLGILTLVLVSCKKENVDPLKDNVLTVGMECDYPPFNWLTSTPTDNSVKISGTNAYCDGYDVKFAKIIAKELGVELEIKALDFDSLIESLRVNDIDVIIAGMSPTERRKQTINFSDIYYISEQVIVVSKTGKYQDGKSINDFEGAKISAQLGTLQVDLISQLKGVIKATPLETYPSLVNALNSNDIDGFIAEEPVAIQIVNNNPNLTYIKLTEENFDVDESLISTAIGIRKENTDLLKKINNILSTITLTQREEWMNEFILQSSDKEE